MTWNRQEVVDVLAPLKPEASKTQATKDEEEHKERVDIAEKFKQQRQKRKELATEAAQKRAEEGPAASPADEAG